MAGRDRVIRYEFDARGKFARLVRIGKISISFFFYLFLEGGTLNFHLSRKSTCRNKWKETLHPDASNVDKVQRVFFDGKFPSYFAC